MCVSTELAAHQVIYCVYLGSATLAVMCGTYPVQLRTKIVLYAVCVTVEY